MPSLTQVAKAAGVSLTTASLVLNKGKQANRVSEACAARVRSVAAEMGYIPNYHARSMKLGRAEVLAVALDVGEIDAPPTDSPEIGSSYYGKIVGGIQAHARSIGYLTAIVGPDREHRAPDRAYLGIRQRRFDGMIVLAPSYEAPGKPFLKEAQDAPIVVVEYSGSTPFPVVDYDESLGVKLAVEHLASLGHRQFLWVGLPPAGGRMHGRERYFWEHVAAAGGQGQACHLEREVLSSSEAADLAEAAMGRFLAAPHGRFTAVVCYNDPVGIGVCGALTRAGLRIPQDVSVVGFDDVEAALCIPRLTTVSHRLVDMGRRASELVLEMVRDESARPRLAGTRVVLPPELILRQSTARVSPV